MKLYQKILVKTANIFYSCKVFGKENIPEESAVICCNHLSAIDVLYLVNHFNKNTFFVAKKELFNKKFSGNFLSSFGGVPIDRENVDVKALMNIVRLLKEGKNMVIFPEGTRNKNGEELQELKSGVIFFAHRAKVPIVPAVFVKKTRIFRFNKIIIGEPYFVENYGKEHTDNEVDKLSNKLKELRSEKSEDLVELTIEENIETRNLIEEDDKN
jgi:1-acyl-sn-glycerol-3-phosphate acyltransferase